MSNNLKTDVLIAHSICSCLQCDSKQTAFLVIFCPRVILCRKPTQLHLCVCVCLKSSTCVYLALPDTLAQGLICRALPSQRAFCSTTVLECFLGHLAGGSRTGAQRSVRPMALLPFAMLGWVWLRSGCSEDSRLCLFSDGMWQQPIGRQRSLAQLHLNHKRDSWSLFFFFFLRVCLCLRRLELKCWTVCLTECAWGQASV